MICWEETLDDSLFSFLFYFLHITLLIIIKKFYQQMTYYFGPHWTKIFEFIFNSQKQWEIYCVIGFKCFTTVVIF